jgi:GT2 family glycosyltransferase
MEHTTMRMGQRIPIRTAAFFCVMMSSKVFKQIGLLDENFGRGFFEDDDYCRRAEKLGLSIVCAEDVFIHHHLSASFNKMGNGEKEKLFNNNKAYYESKWGKWISHEYRM